jgi:hypothetical protein
MNFKILRLNLVSPLLFTPHEGSPFGPIEEQSEGGGESLFCIELASPESLKFEPEPAGLLGALVRTEKPTLPAGLYMFSQMRQMLCKDEILEMAVEIQKEALWQRLIPEPRLYLRYLYEDGRGVTQIFRPYKEPGIED